MMKDLNFYKYKSFIQEQQQHRQPYYKFFESNIHNIYSNDLYLRPVFSNTT